MPQQLFCLCQRPYVRGELMVQCDKCNDWFHPKCVGITAAEAKKIETFFCPGCDGSGGVPARASSDGDREKAKRRPKPKVDADFAYLHPEEDEDAESDEPDDIDEEEDDEEDGGGARRSASRKRAPPRGSGSDAARRKPRRASPSGDVEDAKPPGTCAGLGCMKRAAPGEAFCSEECVSASNRAKLAKMASEQSRGQDANETAFRSKVQCELNDAFQNALLGLNQLERSRLEATDACNHVAAMVEAALYAQLWGDGGKKYNMKARSLTFNLRKNTQLAHKILVGEIVPEAVPRLTSEEMASSEKQAYVHEIRERSLKQAVITEDDADGKHVMKMSHKGLIEVERPADEIAKLIATPDTTAAPLVSLGGLPASSVASSRDQRTHAAPAAPAAPVQLPANLVTLPRPPAPVDIEPGKKLWTGWIWYPTHTPVGAVRVSAYAARGACGHWVDELRLADSCLLSGTVPPDTLKIDGSTAFDKVATWLGGFSSTTAKLKAAVYLEADAGTEADAADPIEAERRQVLGVTSCTKEDNRQRYQALVEKMAQDKKACVVDRQYSIDLDRLADKGVPVFIPEKDKGRVSFFKGFVVYLVPPGPEASRVGAAMLQKDERKEGPPSSEILSEILQVAEGRIIAFVVSALELRPKRL
eukprot:tig00020684_g12877.t1